MELGKITIKNLPNYGYGGYDYCDEWQSNGDYYTTINKGYKDAMHNYYADFRRAYKGKLKYKTTVWICLVASNSRDFKIAEKEFNTLKECRQFFIDCIYDYQSSNRFETEIVCKFLKEKASPVFTINDGIINIIGTTYFGVQHEYSAKSRGFKEMYSYYNLDFPDFKNGIYDYYCIAVNFRDKFSIQHLHGFGGYSLCWMGEESGNPIFKKLLPLMKNDERFSRQYELLRA